MTIHEKLPRVKNCCCCGDLRKGLLFIGFIGLFGVLLSWMRFTEYTILTIKGEEIDLDFPPGDKFFEF